jgi:hypothetical protein
MNKKLLLENPKGKRPFGRYRLWWEDNINVDLRKIGRGIVVRIHLAQDRNQWLPLLNTVMTLRLS